MLVVRQNFKKVEKKTCQTQPDVGINAHLMRMPATNGSKKNLTVIRRVKQARKNGNQESEFQVTNRPQFRASDIMAHALALYNLETAHTVSQTMSMALRQFLPAKYVAQAEQLLKNRKELRA